MKKRHSIAKEIRYRYALISFLVFLGLFFFVLFDVDYYFDARYKQLGISGLAYEIGDHVILPVVLLLLPIFLATPWLVQRSLNSLDLAARRIDEASGSDRGFRVALEGLPAEAIPFASAVNALLRRLDEAAERQEAFAADIAHELKTPLAILSLELRRHGDPLAGKIRAEIADMNRLVDQLLLIAQLDADAVSRAEHEVISLPAVAAEVVKQLAPFAISQGKRLELEDCGGPAIRGRQAAVAAALRNLVENALRVTAVNDAVTVIAGPAATLTVRDGGPGVTPDELRILCQRLSRADHASKTGAGLGLSIVSKVMTSHRGALQARPEDRELVMIFTEVVDEGR